MQQVSSLVPQTTEPGGDVKSFNCKHHGKYDGKIFILDGKEREPMCPQCLISEQRIAEVQHSKDFEAQQRMSLSKLLGHSGIPPRFIQRGFKNYKAITQGQLAALEIAKNYATQFKTMRVEGKGLTFIGSTGTGKTHLATAICKMVIRDGYSAYFTSVLAVMQVIKESYRREAEMTERETIAKFVEVDLLAIDEVGVQHNSDTERMFLTEIINQRYEHMKPTILLSNLPRKSEREMDLITVLGPRIVSRLREVNEDVICDWEDYRAA